MPSLSLFFYSSTPCLVLLYFKVYYHYVTGVIFFIIIVIITIIHFNLALLWSLRNLPGPVIFCDVPWKPKEGSWAPSSKFSCIKVLGDLRCSRAPLLQPGLCTVMRHRESRSRCRMALFGTWYMDSGRWAGHLLFSIPRKNPVTYDTCL